MVVERLGRRRERARLLLGAEMSPSLSAAKNSSAASFILAPQRTSSRCAAASSSGGESPPRTRTIRLLMFRAVTPSPTRAPPPSTRASSRPAWQVADHLVRVRADLVRLGDPVLPGRRRPRRRARRRLVGASARRVDDRGTIRSDAATAMPRRSASARTAGWRVGAAGGASPWATIFSSTSSRPVRVEVGPLGLAGVPAAARAAPGSAGLLGLGVAAPSTSTARPGCRVRGRPRSPAGRSGPGCRGGGRVLVGHL